MATVTLTSAVAGQVATAAFYNNNNSALLNQINGNLDATNLANLAVTGAKIASGAVSGVKIAMGSDAQGDILYHNGTNYARLGAGTSGYFLKTQGAGANPVWAVANTPLGAYVDKSADYGAQQATTDGFVVVFITGGTGNLQGLTDGNANPTTVRCHIGGGFSTAAGSFTFPVKKSDYWKVLVVDGSLSGITVYWLPLGS